jgi:hypothetical protein
MLECTKDIVIRNDLGIFCSYRISSLVILQLWLFVSTSGIPLLPFIYLSLDLPLLLTFMIRGSVTINLII